MTDDQGFELHPGAAQDITEIWQFVAEDNPPVATRLREDILEATAGLWLFRIRVTSGPISPPGRTAFKRSAIISSSMRQKKNPSSLSP